MTAVRQAARVPSTDVLGGRRQEPVAPHLGPYQSLHLYLHPDFLNQAPYAIIPRQGTANSRVYATPCKDATEDLGLTP